MVIAYQQVVICEITKSCNNNHGTLRHKTSKSTNMDNITFEAMPQAISELIQKVDTLQSAVVALQKHYCKPQEEQMIGIDEACKILCRAKSTVYALTQAHKIPFYQPGKMLQFKRSELMTWMESAKQESSVDTKERIAEQMRCTVKHKPKSNWGM